MILIRSIAFLHQYQRPVKTVNHNGKTIRYIEVDIQDIELANRLINHVLGTTLDELPPQTRKLLGMTRKMVTEICEEKDIEQCDYTFTQKDIRDYTGWGHTQLKIHLKRLVEMEYLLVHRAKRGIRYVYELLYRGEGEDGKPFVKNLIDVNKLKKRTDYL